MPSASVHAAALPHHIRLALGATAALAVALIGVTIGGQLTGAELEDATTHLGSVVALLAAVCVLLHARERTPQRATSLVLGAALVTFAAGEALEASVWPNGASPGDVLTAFAWVLVAASLVLLARSWSIRPPASFWLDTAALALAIASVDAAYFVPITVETAGISTASVIVQIATPVLGLAAVFFAAVLLRLSGLPAPPYLLLLGGGATAIWFVDAAQFWSLTNGFEAEISTLHLVVEPCGYVAFALAPWISDRHERRLRMTSWAVAAIPVGTLLTAVMILAAGQWRPINSVAIVLAVAATLVVVMRTVMTFGELRALPEVRREARTDELTGLANRRWFLQRSTRLLADRSCAGAAVLLIDLNRFKELNDALGHSAGDHLLAQLGPRLASAMRPRDLVARLGGDEFAVLCRDADVAAAQEAAERVQRALDAPFLIDELKLHVDASVGVALYPGHASGAEDLIQRADVAMYEAKAHHQPVAFYDPARDAHTRERLQLVEDLRRALDDLDGGGLTLHYQPQVTLSTGRIDAVEALIRWNHPEHGVMRPDAFLSVAAGGGMMRRVTSFVLRTAIAQLATWERNGLDIAMAVNLSASDAADARLATEVELLLSAHGVSADHLNVELTETDVMVHPERTLATLQRIRDLGCTVSLDDFGTGHSSLSLLKMLPVDELKIDRTFVSGLLERGDDAAIVRAALSLGRDFGLRVVAEGVETDDVLAELRALGVSSAQGYLFSPAVPAGRLEQQVRAGRLPGMSRPTQKGRPQAPLRSHQVSPQATR